MKEKLLKQIQILSEKYYHFFDKKLDNSTITVGIIWFFIFSVWISFSQATKELNTSYMKTNLLENRNNIVYTTKIDENTINKKTWIIYINWKQYKIVLEETNNQNTSDINKIRF